ncbi:L-aspartate oxidase [Desulfothermus okinawensis JCM 13304]
MLNEKNRIYIKVLVIGTGIAGCSVALTLANKGIPVTLVTSGEDIDTGNTPLAQGGIVYKGIDDSPKLLQKDILTAGWNYNYLKSVNFLSKKGPEVVNNILIKELNIPFEKHYDSSFKLTKEGGHSLNRILYCGDYTGRAIIDGFIKKIKNHPNITILTKHTAIDLITSHHHSTKLEFKYHILNQCIGAYIYNQELDVVETIMADYTVLATGGVGQIYLHTTNSPTSIGSGLVMAYRSGARVMNCEFVQFHPTALYERGGQKFLISEALRGEGARFVRIDGTPFMKEYDPRGDLAPRDIVTRAIVEEMLKTGDDFVYLDAADFVKKDIPKRFPTIYKRCLDAGYDITKEPIPVVPAAHFFCGGVLVDLEGKTTLNRLYAVGEVSCTGVHGANRLASTSLLEGLVWGHTAGLSISKRLQKKTQLSKRLMDSIPNWSLPGTNDNEDPALIAQDWLTIKHTMWNYVGIARTTSRLKRAREDLNNLSKRLYEFYRNTPISKNLIDLFHGCQSSIIITNAAYRNTKTVGCHFRVNK